MTKEIPNGIKTSLGIFIFKKERIVNLKLINWILFTLLFIYNILDAWHTKLLLATGLIVEANPLMNYFIQNYGINSLFFIKFLVLSILGVGLFLNNKKFK